MGGGDGDSGDGSTVGDGVPSPGVLPVGPAVGDGSGAGAEKVSVGAAVGLGVGSGVGGSDGDGTGDGLGDRLGAGTVRGGVGRGAGAGAAGRRADSVSDGAGGRGAAGSSTGGGGRVPMVVGATEGEPAGTGGGWSVAGTPMTTGPTDGVGMKGVPLSGMAVLPTVADPALIAARMGIEAVPARSATVKR